MPLSLFSKQIVEYQEVKRSVKSADKADVTMDQAELEGFLENKKLKKKREKK